MARFPDLEEVRLRLDLNPDTGVITWVRPKRQTHRLGLPAGTVTANGYRLIHIAGTWVYGHQVAWALTHGAWPSGPIDHVNGDRLDNRPCNLRIATRAQQAWNTVRAQGDLPRWVSRRKNRYIARMRVRGRHVYIGMFKTATEAGDAARAASLALHGAFSAVLRDHA